MEKEFEVLDEDLALIWEKEITYSQDWKDEYKKGDKGIIYNCPYDHGQHCNSQSTNKQSVIYHMKTCYQNPRHKVWSEKCKREYDNMFKTFGFDWDDHEAKETTPTKLENPKFLMAASYRHKAFSNLDIKTFDLVQVTHETKDAYLGAFVFGIGMFHVIFPKANGNVRELNEEEIEKYHGNNIAINNNPAHTSLNIKEDKYDKPIYK